LRVTRIAPSSLLARGRVRRKSAISAAKPVGMRILTASALALALGACASTPEPIVQDRSRCDAYGFQRGTDAFAHCVMTADRDRQRRQESQGERGSYIAPDE